MRILILIAAFIAGLAVASCFAEAPLSLDSPFCTDYSAAIQATGHGHSHRGHSHHGHHHGHHYPPQFYNGAPYGGYYGGYGYYYGPPIIVAPQPRGYWQSPGVYGRGYYRW